MLKYSLLTKEVIILKNVKDNSTNQANGFNLNTEAQVDDLELWVQISCPFCLTGIVYSRQNLTRSILCSSSSCRRVIAISNFDKVS
jgi:hypothetical protein